MKIFSFDLSGEFAFFKKNDANDIALISYNFIHRPVILGLIGAILGIPGYSKSSQNLLPEYFNRLKKLKISIEPYYHKPLKKVITGFNNASGLASRSSEGQGQTWQIKEQILVGEPEIRYTIFILDNDLVDSNLIEDLRNRLKNGETEFPLYYGKNEFFAHHENYVEYDAEILDAEETTFVSLVRLGEKKEESSLSFKAVSFDDFDIFDMDSNEGRTIYEYLPYGLDEHGFYKKDLFVLTERKLTINKNEDFYKLRKNGEESFDVQFI